MLGAPLDSAASAPPQPPLHPDVQKLLAVQNVDQKVASLRRDLDSVLAETARREKKIADLRKTYETRRGELLAAELEARRNEKAIQAADDEVKKLDTRLNTVKNNAEYQAILFQIEAVKKERGQLEEAGLQGMENLDKLRAGIDQASRLLAEEEKTFREFQKEAERLKSEREADIAKVRAGRQDLTKDLPKELLARYERLFQHRDSLAVCAVEGQICQGCYTNVPVNDVARLMGKSAVVVCGSCQRILYLAH